MSPTVTVVHPDDSTETIPQTVRYTRTRELNKMRRARITVERSLASAVSLTRKRDRIELGDIDDLVLVDLERAGSTVTLVCYSYEWLANRVPFMQGGEERQGDDAALINGLIDDVGDWTAGDINTFTGPMTWIFNHAHRHDALRRIERNTPGELRFRDGGTVDYVDQLGTDKSGSIELSGDAGTLEEELTITERGREMDGTHIRVLGAHEGEAQIFANLVPEDDPQAYENEVRYSTPRWESAEDTDWNRWEDKDITDQGALEEEAAALGEEITDEYVEAEAVVSGVDLSLGDRVQAVKPSQDLDRTMRVHRIKTVQEGATRTDKVRLSTRTRLRQDDSDLQRDIRKFNAGFQGSSVVVNPGPFGKAVDSGDPFTFKFRYPNLAFENTAEVQVTGLPYRIDSVGAASGGGEHSHTVPINVVSDNSATVETENDTLAGYNNIDQAFALEDIPTNSTGARVFATLFVDGNASINRIVLNDDTEGETLWDIPIDGSNSNIHIKFPVDTFTVDRKGNTLEALVFFDSANSGDLNLIVSAEQSHFHVVDETETTDTETPEHTHPPLPGIYTTNDVPSNVDVAVNGTQVASNIGTGTFETTVDVGGEFTNDAWNEVEVSSDSLGIVEVSAFIEGYDKIGTQSP
jgi:hypothetical protein